MAVLDLVLPELRGGGAERIHLELARGFVLSCQSFPVTDELLIDFDQET